MNPAASAWCWATRHQIRELRIRAGLWILGVSVVGAAFALGWQHTYPTELSRRASAMVLEGVPVFEAVSGRTVALSTVEGFVLWRWGGFATLLVAAWAISSTSSLLRVAEAEGRTELLRARMLSPRMLAASSLSALIAWFAVLGLCVTVTHAAAGFDLRTAATFGAALAALATLVAAVTTLVAQLAPSARATTRIVGTAVVAAVLVRVVAAASWAPAWLWWATPFGWTTFLHESDDARARVFALFGACTLVMVPIALLLSRRDLHGGGRITLDRPARWGQGARMVPVGDSHLRFAWRTASTTAAGWVIAIVIAGGVMGVLSQDFAAAVATIPEAGTLGRQVGWQLDSTAGVVGSLLLLLAPTLALLGAGQIASLRDDEASTRLEALLVRPLGRSRWLATRVASAAVWIALAASLAVLAAWTGASIVGASLAATDAVRTAANLLPVAWMFLGLGVAAFGLAPRLVTTLTPTLVLGAFVFDLVGGLFDVPDWIRRLGPFRYVRPVPGVEADVVAAIAMITIGLVTATIGSVAFRRRDLCGA